MARHRFPRRDMSRRIVRKDLLLCLHSALRTPHSAFEKAAVCQHPLPLALTDFKRPKATFQRNLIERMRLIQSFQPFQRPQNSPLSPLESNRTEFHSTYSQRLLLLALRDIHRAWTCQRSKLTSSVSLGERLLSLLPPRQDCTLAHYFPPSSPLTKN